jgi:hypothetical protein
MEYIEKIIKGLTQLNMMIEGFKSYGQLPVVLAEYGRYGSITLALKNGKPQLFGFDKEQMLEIDEYDERIYLTEQGKADFDGLYEKHQFFIPIDDNVIDDILECFLECSN